MEQPRETTTEDHGRIQRQQTTTRDHDRTSRHETRVGYHNERSRRGTTKETTTGFRDGRPRRYTSTCSHAGRPRNFTRRLARGTMTGDHPSQAHGQIPPFCNCNLYHDGRPRRATTTERKHRCAVTTGDHDGRPRRETTTEHHDAISLRLTTGWRAPGLGYKKRSR